MRELFIYYRSRTERSAEVAERIREFQAGLCRRHPHLVARLLRRPETRDGLQTWMETYSIATMFHPDGVSAELQQDIEAQASVLRSCIEGERHTEVFTACAW
jgi:Domain of unknown function (DUF4936)